MRQSIYLGSVSLRDFGPFRGEHSFDLRDAEGNVYQWTVILGNNNAGKTFLLKAIADLEAVDVVMEMARGVKARLSSDFGGAVELSVKTGPSMPCVPAARYYRRSLANPSSALVSCDLLLGTSEPGGNPVQKFDAKRPVSHEWYYGGHPSAQDAQDKAGELKEFKIFGYGVARRHGASSLVQNARANSESLFDPEATLLNVEEWLLRLDYAAKSKNAEAERQLKKIRELIKSDVFPEIEDFRFKFSAEESYLEFETPGGWRRLRELGYGYQTTLSWIFDFSQKMFARYPDAENPLAEAAIVLVDELDLHLHPRWQREIIGFLTKTFPKTQFIVSTHSPFILQSIQEINLFVLEKDQGALRVHRPPFKTFKGWTIEEILEEIHGMEGKTQSDEFRILVEQLDKAMDRDDFEAAQDAYKRLEAILHPTSHLRKMLRLQISQIAQP